MSFPSEATRAIRMITLGLGVCALAACTAQFRNHGYIPPEEELSQIVPGIDTRASVEDVIGVPSTSGVVNDSGMYYVQSQVRHYAWQRPKVIDRDVLAITFDEAGVVSNIVSYGLEDGKVVPLVRRVTKSGDGDISFIRKLFGNIGGFSAANLLN